ncbi:hypothetical protein ACSHWO_34595 [Streptomyces sp. HUAS TT3]|uniref:hypothetical protein n=1 Tax=Streptomyces sp. HUAS TT3 TaxID=3447510 RepID=UPI003F659A13
MGLVIAPLLLGAFSDLDVLATQAGEARLDSADAPPLSPLVSTVDVLGDDVIQTSSQTGDLTSQVLTKL